MTEGVQRTLAMASAPVEAGPIAIAVAHPDATGGSAGDTSFQRFYADGSVVRLSAPQTSGSYVFRKWTIDALDFSTGREIELQILGDETLTAVYTHNNPPSTTADSYVVERDLELIIVSDEGVLANDNDPDGSPLSAELVTGPAFGDLTLNPDGSFTYVPDQGHVGADGFTYQASDGVAASSATTVSLTVMAPVGGLLANGGFEVGSPVEFGPLYGWTILAGDPFGYPQNSFPGATYEPSAGVRMAVFNGGNNDFTDSISQAFPTVPGQRYVLEFDLGITGTAGRQQRMDISLASGAGSWNWQESVTSTGPGSTFWKPAVFAFIAADKFGPCLEF